MPLLRRSVRALHAPPLVYAVIVLITVQQHRVSPLPRANLPIPVRVSTIELHHFVSYQLLLQTALEWQHVYSPS